MRRKNDIREVELEIERPGDRASRTDNTQYEDASITASAHTALDGSKTVASTELFSVSEVRYLESLTATVNRNRAPDVRFAVSIRDENDTMQKRVRFHPGDNPDFDPAIKMKDGWDVLVELANPCPFPVDATVFSMHRAEVNQS